MFFFFICILSSLFKIQALFVVNILQFVFLALRFDNSLVTWNYTVVFIPLWIVLSASILFCVCRAIWTIVHYHRGNMTHLSFAHHRQCQTLAGPAVGHICVLMFILIFSILLAHYLDQTYDFSFTIVCLPLYAALIILIYTSFGTRVPTNHWWFGLRQDACAWILHLCPIFETYANIEYHFNSSNSPSLSTSMHSIDDTITRDRGTVLNQTMTQSRRHRRRFRFRKKPNVPPSSSSLYDQNKCDLDENGILTTTTMLSTCNTLALHVPD